MSLAHAVGRQSRRWLLHWPVLANAATVGAFATAVKVAAAVKIAVTAKFFGAGDELDAYLIAFIVPVMFADTVAGAFTPSLVPALIRVRGEQGPAAARRLARSGAAVAMAVMLGIAVLCAAGAGWFLPVLGSSFSPGKLRLATALFLAMLCWLPFGALIAAWRAILNAHGRFALAAAGPLAAPLLTIALLYAGAARWGVYVLVAGTLAGVAAECALLAGAVSRLQYPVLPAFPAPLPWRAWTPELRGVFRQYLPLMAGAIMLSAGVLIDQAFAGALGSGSVSVLTYGTKLAGVVAIVGANAIATAVLPEFSHLVARGQWGGLRRAALTYAGLLSALMIPAIAVLMWFSEPLARLFFERGAFHASDTHMVAVVQRLALLEAPVAVCYLLASRLATVLAANSLLAQVGGVALLFNVLVDWWLASGWGVAGLAVSPALVRTVSVILLVAMLWKREPRLFARVT